jgi:cation transport ATPase
MYQPDIAAMSEIIQLAVAPVFLLAGLGSLLMVLSNRLGRITDRARVLEQRKYQIKNDQRLEQLHKELKSLWKRARLANWAITLCTSSALLVSLVIVTLFIGDFVLIQFDLPNLIGLLFITAMCLLIVALICFLREIFHATKSMRLGVEVLVDIEDIK